MRLFLFFFFFQAEDGIRDLTVTGVQTCALPILSCFDLAILLHQRRVRLDARRHGSSTTNGWPPSRVLRRRWACAASSCDAYRPTRTLNKPLVSRTTRASNPITFRRLSISSTCAALFTANTWTAYVAAGDAGFA